MEARHPNTVNYEADGAGLRVLDTKYAKAGRKVEKWMQMEK